jgi:flavin-dependent dehydrogenase
MVAGAIALDALGREPWDAVVIGAGVAGGVMAAQLAERGWRVLLVERQAWPRAKACGGCLNAAGVRILRTIGLGEPVAGATALTQFEVHVRGRKLSLRMPPGVAVARQRFDAALVTAALRRGGEAVAFVHGCAARVLGGEDAAFRHVRLQRGGEDGEEAATVRGRVVFACDGIHGSSLQDEPWAAWRPAADAWIGVATTLETDHGLSQVVPEGTIAMFVARDGAGYVGLVRQEGGQVHVGAAVSPSASNRARGPARLLSRILGEHGVEVPALTEAVFEGTRPLTGSRAAVAGRRVLVVGDSCGYVEPFTGEGMSWAIRGAVGAVSVLPQRIDEWLPEMEAPWAALHAREVAARQAWCWHVRGVVRRPRLAAAWAGLARVAPAIAERIVRRIGT